MIYTQRPVLSGVAVALSIISAVLCIWSTKASAASHVIHYGSTATNASAEVVPPFKVSIIGETVPKAPTELRLTQVVIIGAKRSEQVTADCRGCRGSGLGPLRTRRNKALFSPSHEFVTAGSRLVIAITDAGLIGRFKEYTLRPRLRSHRLVQQGCLAIAAPVRTSCVALGVAEHVGPAGTVLATEPSCPSSPCLAISRTTGFQVNEAAFSSISTVRENGYIVAWQIDLGKPSLNQIAFFNANEGGVAEAGIAVLRPQPPSNLTYRLIAQSPLIQLQPYFGTTMQLSLEHALHVEPEDVIALTVPTWAPALALGLGNGTTWRGSRPQSGCTSTGTQTSQTQIGSLVQYFCLYQTAVLTYSATLSPSA
jgi:hypothetical protein